MADARTKIMLDWPRSHDWNYFARPKPRLRVYHARLKEMIQDQYQSIYNAQDPD